MNLETFIDEKTYNKFKGSDWPNYQSFLINDYSVNENIKNELNIFIEKMVQRFENLTSYNTIELSDANRIRQNQTFYNKDYNGTNKCNKPWNTLGINNNGNIFICSSPSWIPLFIGNLLETEDIFDILNNNLAKQIRFEINNNRYYYCNSKICSFFSNVNNYQYQKNISHIDDYKPLEIPFHDPSLIVKKIPKELIFDFDYSCNFKCPSCRVEYQNYNNHHIIRPTNDKISDKVKQLIIDKIKDESVIIRWCGGEPFLSEVYINLFNYIIEKNNNNIKNIIQTNGSLLIAKQTLVEKFLPYVKELRISFDAGCEQTYKKTRVGGDWKNLLKNVEFVQKLIAEKNINTVVSADFVVQKNNYKDLPLFSELCKKYNLNMNIQKMWNWGTWDTEVFNDMNVYSTHHPLYKDVSKYFSLANLHMAKN